MKLEFQKLLSRFLIIWMALFLVHCGGSGSGGTIRIVVNGQTLELDLKNAQCNAGAPSGDGIYNLPLVCTAGFANTGGITDSLVVTITDARAVQDALGAFIPISPSLLIMSLTLDGTQLPITNGGAVFSAISNIAGGETSFDFQADSAQAHIEGNFDGRTVTGF